MSFQGISGCRARPSDDTFLIRENSLYRFENVSEVEPIVLHSPTASLSTRSRIQGLKPSSTTTSTLRFKAASTSSQKSMKSRNPRPGPSRTRRSMSLSGPASPRAAEPNTRGRSRCHGSPRSHGSGPFPRAREKTTPDSSLSSMLSLEGYGTFPLRCWAMDREARPFLA